MKNYGHVKNDRLRSILESSSQNEDDIKFALEQSEDALLDDSENPEIPFEIVDVREKSYNEADHAYFMEKDTGKAISAIQAFWFV